MPVSSAFLVRHFVGLLALLLVPALATTEPLPDETLKSLLTQQPDHIADYTFTLAGGNVAARVAVRGSSVMSALMSDLLSDGGFRYYRLRDAAGHLYGVRTQDRTYSQLQGTDGPMGPILGALYSDVTRAGGTVTAQVSGDGSMDGLKVTKMELKIKSESMSGKIEIETAPSLRHLVVGLKQKGTPSFAYMVSHASLDPPESLFTIPAGYTEVAASAAASPAAKGAATVHSTADGEPTVFGSIRPEFYKYGETAVLPKSVEMPWMRLMRVDDESESEYAFVRGPGELAVSLRPGEYRIVDIQLQGPGLSSKPFKLPTFGPTFVVPKTGCVDIGSITIEVIRLPAGTMEADAAMMNEIRKKVEKQLPDFQAIFLRLDTGSLVPSPGGVQSSKPTGEKADCPERLAKF